MNTETFLSVLPMYFCMYLMTLMAAALVAMSLSVFVDERFN